MEYINENEKIINNQNILEYLNRTVPKSNILKNIALRNVSVGNQSVSLYAGQILGDNFKDDPIVFKEVKK